MDVQTLRLSSSGDLLAIGGKVTCESTATVKILKLGTGASRDIATRQSNIASLSFSVDERRLACVSDIGGVVILDALNGQRLQSLASSAVRHIAFAPGNRWIVGGGEEGLLIWDGRSYKHRHSIRTSSVTSLNVSSDGDRIVTGSSDGLVRVWQPETGKLAIDLEFNVPDGDPTLTVGSAVFSRIDERLVACALHTSRMCINVWDGTSANGQLPERTDDLIRRRMQGIRPTDGWQYPVRLASAYVHRLRESEHLHQGSEKTRLAELFQQVEELPSDRDSSLEHQWNAIILSIFFACILVPTSSSPWRQVMFIVPDSKTWNCESDRMMASWFG